MSDNAWRSLLAESSRRGISSLRNVKDYFSQRDFREQLGTVRATGGSNNNKQQARQGWREWAGEKIKYGRTQSHGARQPPEERVSLFPGWAVKRYRNRPNQDSLEAFEVDVFISGFAASHRSPENATRAQRTFMRLAKSFAALPKLVADVASPESEPTTPHSPSTEDPMATVKLPPRPSEVTDDYEIQALERELQRATQPGSGDSLTNEPSAQGVPSHPLVSQPESISAIVAADLRKLHENLEQRLRPFWSSSLSGRTIRVSLYSTANHEPTFSYEPLASHEFVTTADGSFQGHVTIKWEDLCQHPKGLHIAFGEAAIEHDLLLLAELMPSPPSLPTPTSSSDESSPTDRCAPYPIYRANSMKIPTRPLELAKPTAETKIRITVTHSPIRVISDIDDTVKRSNILSGARTVFHNVFVKEFNDIIIPGMGEWYTNMWSKGVRFHYVSNGPFELLPVVIDFFQASQLPPGSIKLKSYAGRSLFNGLLSAPANRKRAGVQDILEAFPQSRFILVGDSGEQDLELYSEIAQERPEQILAVFIRYAEDSADMISDPTGWKAVGAVVSPSSSPDHRNLTTPNSEQPSPRRTLSDVLANVSIPKPKGLSLSIPIPIPSRSPSPTSRRRTSAKSEVQKTGYYFTSTPLTAEPEQYSPSSTSESNQSCGFDGSPSANANTSNANTTANTSTKLMAPSLSLSTSASASASSSSHLPPPRRPTSIASSSSMSISSAYLRMSEPERKKMDLQTRVYKARTQMPGHIPLRVFRNPEECVEAEVVLRREGM